MKGIRTFLLLLLVVMLPIFLALFIALYVAEAEVEAEAEAEVIEEVVADGTCLYKLHPYRCLLIKQETDYQILVDGGDGVIAIYELTNKYGFITAVLVWEQEVEI